jgi:hypothetical protein
MWGYAGITVMIAQLLVDFGKRGFLVGCAAALPEDTKALVANGALNVGVAIRRVTQNLHGKLLSKTAVRNAGGGIFPSPLRGPFKQYRCMSGLGSWYKASKANMLDRYAL